MSGELTFNGHPWVTDYVMLKAAACPCCGAVRNEYPYNISWSHVVFMTILKEHGAPARKKQLPRLPGHSNYTNGASAWLWGLIVSGESANRGPWSLTEAGLAFLSGALKVPSHVVVLKGNGDQRGAIARYEGEPVGVEKVAQTQDGGYYGAIAVVNAAYRAAVAPKQPL